MANIGIGNFIRDYAIPIIMILATIAISIYTIYLSRRMKPKNEESENN